MVECWLHWWQGNNIFAKSTAGRPVAGKNVLRYARNSKIFCKSEFGNKVFQIIGKPLQAEGKYQLYRRLRKFKIGRKKYKGVLPYET